LKKVNVKKGEYYTGLLTRLKTPPMSNRKSPRMQGALVTFSAYTSGIKQNTGGLRCGFLDLLTACFRGMPISIFLKPNGLISIVCIAAR
jgi:hypothetical protein